MNLEQRKIELENALDAINKKIQRRSRLDQCKDLTELLYTQQLIKDLKHDYQFEFQLNEEETPRHFKHHDFLTIKNLSNLESYNLDVVLENVKLDQIVDDIARLIVLGQLRNEFRSQNCEITSFSQNSLRLQLTQDSSKFLVKIYLRQTTSNSSEFEVIVSILSWIHEFESFTKSIVLNGVECHYEVSLDNEDEIDLDAKLTLPLIARPSMSDDYANLMSTLILEFVNHHAEDENQFFKRHRQ